MAEWRDAEGYERGEAQSFVRDLLRVFGITRSTAAVYEKRAQRASTGGQGYIDALISGTALVEMKSAGADLVKAEAQALDYIESLTEHERPDFVITSDFRRFRLLDLTADAGKDGLLEFELEELPAHVEDRCSSPGTGARSSAPPSRSRHRSTPHSSWRSSTSISRPPATTTTKRSMFLIRTLFCLYADDSGLWERDLFSRYIEERTSEDGSDLGAQLATLYQALNKPEDKRYGQNDDLIQAFPYVNGSVFGEAVEIPYFDRASREHLLQAAYFNWSTISPAIFGSLFQAVKDKKARRKLGEHYTTETNILKLIRPLFLDELEERFTKAYDPRSVNSRNSSTISGHRRSRPSMRLWKLLDHRLQGAQGTRIAHPRAAPGARSRARPAVPRRGISRARKALPVPWDRDRGVARHDRTHRHAPRRAPGQPVREPHARLHGPDAPPPGLRAHHSRKRTAHRLDGRPFPER